MTYVVTLTGADLEFGQRLTSELKQRGFPYRGVFWLFDDASNDWQLVVATDLVDEAGPRKTYLQLSKVTKTMTATMTVSDFQLLRIAAMSPRNPIYMALRSVFGTAASVEGVRLHQTTVNGLLISDAYLYEVR